MFWLSFLFSFGGSLLFVPLVRWISLRLGKIEKPREDRWHNRPVPTLGGVGIYLGFLLALVGTKILGIDQVETHWGLVIGSGLVFFLGLIDDFSPLTPPTKLVGQILAASTVIFLGYSTNFFTPRISNEILAQILNTLLTFLWIIGITNAVNLLDNMDGLAGGIVTITAIILAFLFWRGGTTSLMVFALALGGGTLGFLVFNFPPARIFMGDSGSQFLGFSLAVLAIARQPQASNVFAILGVPTLVFLLPILDTTFVTITRLLQGQSPVRGGRDHTSHRLVAFGLSERQALVVLYGVAVTSGVIGLTIETLDYWLSLVIVPLLVISLALFTAYFSRIKMVESIDDVRKGSLISLIVNLTYKRRLFEIILDFFLIGTAYYLAFLTNYGLSVSLNYLEIYQRSLPLAFAGAYIAFFIFGVYRGVWRYIGIDDLLRYAKATVAGVAILVLTHQLLPEIGRIVPGIFILFSLFLFLGLAMTRSSFKVLDQIFGQHTRLEGERVLILGGGDSGEMALRWIFMNPDIGYNPVGILDGNPLNTGRHVHGVTILGDYEKLAIILADNSIDGVVITGDLIRIDEQYKQILSVCKSFGCWVRVLRLEFELLEGINEFNNKYPGA